MPSDIVKCPFEGCAGFTTKKMADAFVESPDIFDESFHEHLGHYAETLDRLLERHSKQNFLISAMWHQLGAYKFTSVDPTLVLENLGKLIEAAIC